MIDETYKSDVRIGKPPSSVIDISYFKKLYDLLSEISEESKNLEVSLLDEKLFKSSEEYEDAKKNVSDLITPFIEIRGNKGEYILSKETTILDESSLPNSIKQISFDNSYLFRYTLNRDPSNYYHIEFDFSKQSIFDFSIGPSVGTSNTSNIKIVGQHKTWVQGSYERIISTLEGYNTKRSWLHLSNIYDLLVWLFVIPLTFLNLSKLEYLLDKFSVNINTLTNVAVHLYIFMIMLFVFMIFFKYTRWLFPYMELKFSLFNTALKHRFFWTTIFLAMIADVVIVIGKLIF